MVSSFLILIICLVAFVAHGRLCTLFLNLDEWCQCLQIDSWMTGPNWPNNGEIDIIEGVNSKTENQMTMHTNQGCTLVNQDCQGKQGCSVVAGGSSSYGSGLNSVGGGIYATEWTSNSIKIWFFTHDNAPDDISGPNPNPRRWGNSTSTFVGGSGCDIDSHFNNNNIVFDTTFCGDWAGNDFLQDPVCSALGASSCQDYVQNTPEAFEKSYWAVNSLKVYEQSNSTSTVSTAQDTSSSQTISIAQSTPSTPIVPVSENTESSTSASTTPVSSDSATPTTSSGGSPVVVITIPVVVVTETVTKVITTS